MQLRLSQFITTYGVGSLIDIPDAGPCVVLSFRYSGLFGLGKTPNEFLISNFGTSRLSKRLLYRSNNSHISLSDMHDKIGIFELPSNASYDENITDAQTIYNIKRFPNWSLCESENHRWGILHKRFSKCPYCHNIGASIDFSASDRNAIRFVSICPEGHLNDVNWNYHVHKQGNLSCDPPYFIWRTFGTNEIQIRCPKCQNSCNLNDIIRFGEKCQCFWPEEVEQQGISSLFKYRKDNNLSCGEETQIIPRNSTSVFVPEVITAISTPLEANEFYKILNYNPIAKLLRKYANEVPPKNPPDITIILQALSDKIKENETNIRQLSKMIKDILDEKMQRNFEEAINKYRVDVNKLNRYKTIINDRLQEPTEIYKINKLIEDFYQIFLINKGGLSEEDFRREELNVFLGQSRYLDYPEVERTLVVDIDNAITVSFRNLEFKITPVPKLEVIMVQQGYKRICYSEDAPKPKIVPTPYIEEIEDGEYGNWYPGVRLNGEGIFIELLSNGLNLEPATNQWMDLSLLINKYSKKLKIEQEKTKSRDEFLKEEEIEKINLLKKKKSLEILKSIVKKMTSSKKFFGLKTLNERETNLDENFYQNLYNWIEKFIFRKLEGDFIHPLGIWWHSFSHRIIKAISADCGYSLASIRERIYVNNEDSGLKAGILLYSARPGMDGTMGGLVYQVPRFERILKRALENIDMCSNDPICGTNHLELGKLNGAACYACLFLPETSCEFGNIGLDRNLLIGSIK